MMNKYQGSTVDHVDLFRPLSEAKPIEYKLNYLHHLLRTDYPFLVRMALAIYEPVTDLLKTYASHDQHHTSLYHYEFRLSESESLQDLRDRKINRVINDLSVTENIERLHSQKVVNAGFQASYTMPLFHNGIFLGFAFFNANRKDCFTEMVLPDLDMVGHILALLLADERNNIHLLRSVISACMTLTQHRNPEYGAHLKRLTHYTKHIARSLAESHELSASFIEHLSLFAPMYDLGRLNIPSRILIRSDASSVDEIDELETRSDSNTDLLQELIQFFGLGCVGHIQLLKNIVDHHHIPHSDQQSIPIESQIIRVAVKFDHLHQRSKGEQVEQILEQLCSGEHSCAPEVVKGLRQCLDQLLEGIEQSC